MRGDDFGAPERQTGTKTADTLQIAPERAARKKKGPAPWRPEERVSDRFWLRDFEPGTTQKWRDRCAADRARRTVRQWSVDYTLQRRARMDAVRTFGWYLQEGVDNGHQQLEQYWPGWAAVAH